MKTGAALLADIDTLALEPHTLAFWWWGQMSFVVKVAGKVLYFDPYLAESAARSVPPLAAATTITHADWVFGSHDHADHIDPVAIQGIAAASPQARFVCSRVSGRHVRELGVAESRIVTLDDGVTVESDGLRISAIAAEHEFFDRDPVLGYPHLCYIVEAGGRTILHLGDTLRYDGMTARLKRWQFDVMFVPINGRDAARYARNCLGNMTYQEAVDMAGALRPGLTVPGHYEMFTNNSQDPHAFADYMRVKFPDLRFWIGEHGEAVVFGDT